MEIEMLNSSYTMNFEDWWVMLPQVTSYAVRSGADSVAPDAATGAAPIMEPATGNVVTG